MGIGKPAKNGVSSALWAVARLLLVGPVVLFALSSSAQARPPTNELQRIGYDVAQRDVIPAQFDVQRQMRRFLRRSKPGRRLRRELRRWRRAPKVFEGLVAPHIRRRADCISPDQIHKRLRAQGWWDFGALSKQDNEFRVEARRPNGVGYVLRIDNCSGRILDAKRIPARPGAQRLWPR